MNKGSNHPWWRDINRQQWLVLGAAFLGWTMDSTDFALYLMAMPTLQQHFGFGPDIAGLLVTVTIITSAIGGIFFGYVADRIGRARTMLLTIGLFSIGSIGTATAESLNQLIFWRALIGFGLGGEWPAAVTLISETWPEKHRGKAVGMMHSGWALGYIIAALMAGLVLPSLGWRWLFALGGLPAIALLWFRREVKESSAWQAQRALAKEQTLSALAHFSQIWAPAWRRATLLAVALLSAVMFGYFGVFSWMPSFLASPIQQGGAGLGLVKSLAWIVPMQCGAFMGYISFGWLADLFGRRRTLICFLLSAAFLVPLYGSVVRSQELLMLIGPLLGFAGHGYFGVFGPLIAELFPTQIRATAQGFCYNMGKIIGSVAPFVIGSAAVKIGIGPALFLNSAAFLVGAVITRYALSDINTSPSTQKENS